MKKLISLFTSLVMVFAFAVSVKAQGNDISIYQDIVNELNSKYNSQIEIFDEDTYTREYESIYGMTYAEYIHNILSTDIETFKNEWLNVLKGEDTVNVRLIPVTRSSYGTKTVYFNSNANKMTLSYKYSGNTFDTRYKPTATVSRVLSYTYFEMQSYTGSFKNSNRTYSVVAKGRVITTYGIVNNKTFTVNFNL